jgi:Alpha amylase, catalytic domain
VILYEINTAVWLAGRTLDEVAFDDIPDVDAVWLMGVWQRSPAGRAIAIETYPELTNVIGSPYCVRDYVVDERFGGAQALAHARGKLASRGLKLILDFVPNHVAPDHPWVTEHPDYFIHEPDGTIARGRDPYFPPWTDVLQLNAFSPGLREAVAQTLVAIGDQCDGVRCDMAMLVTNEVFARTWGLEPPEQEYWSQLIGRVPGLTFIAEAYWDMEWTLQQQGFDYCYDKRLYDRLVHEGGESVRGHLQADRAYQERLIRFIENHDEPRAATALGERHRAAAVVMSTVPGARLYHDGQFEGRREHIPVQVDRAPDEPVDEDLRSFYTRLLRAAREMSGDWRLCESENPALVAWAWAEHLVVVNLGDTRAWGRVDVPWTGDVVLDDRLSGERYERGEELWVGLEPWGAHLFHWSPG